MQHQTGSVMINGTEMHYEIAGSGHPLVLVHAGIADRRMWDDQFPVLAEHYRVVRYDLRGYGQTAPIPGPFSHRKDLRDLLAHLGIEHAYLLGCSMGGGMIVDFALEYPGIADALIAIGASPSGLEFESEPPTQWNELVAAYKARDFARAAELEVQIWVDGRQRTPDQVPSAIRQRVLEMDMLALAHEATGNGEEQPLDPPALGRLAAIAVPTLIIYGDLDEPPILEGSESLATSIPNARKVIMHGTAHLPNMERPDEFNRIVLDFLGEVAVHQRPAQG